MRKGVGFLLIGLALLACSGLAAQAAITAAVDRAKGQVKIGKGRPIQAEVDAMSGSAVKEENYIRTGAESLVAIRFSNGAYSRLGPQSIFRFTPETQNFILERGEGILVFPKGEGGATVSTSSFAAGILGTTVYVRTSRNLTVYNCMEGRCQIGPHILSAGENLIIRGRGTPYTVPKTNYDLREFLEENELANAFGEELPSADLIRAEAAGQ